MQCSMMQTVFEASTAKMLQPNQMHVHIETITMKNINKLAPIVVHLPYNEVKVPYFIDSLYRRMYISISSVKRFLYFLFHFNFCVSVCLCLISCIRRSCYTFSNIILMLYSLLTQCFLFILSFCIHMLFLFCSFFL